MPWFLCVYPPKPHMPVDIHDNIGDYSSFIKAVDKKAANRLARNRNLGEKVICLWGGKGAPYQRPSEILSKRTMTPKQRMSVIHGTCWLSYLLMQSMKTPPADTVGDEGILHQVIHYFSFSGARKQALIDTLRHYEQLVPGYV